MKGWAETGAAALVVGVATLAMAGPTPVARAQDHEDGPRRRVEVVRFAGGGARLGIDIEDVRAEDVARLKLAEERGARVQSVTSGSAADKAGLKDGDVVLAYQGEKVWSAAQLRRLVRETPPGRKVTVEVSRGGALQRLAATVEEAKDHEMALGDEGFHFDVPMPPVPPMAPMPPMDRLLEDGGRGRRFLFRDRVTDGHPGRLGLSYQELSGQLARYFKAEDGALLVTDVDADGPAGHAGLRAGDVIVKLDGKAVTDSEVLRRGLADAAGDVTLTVQRDGHALDLKVTPRSR